MRLYFRLFLHIEKHKQLKFMFGSKNLHLKLMTAISFAIFLFLSQMLLSPHEVSAAQPSVILSEVKGDVLVKKGGGLRELPAVDGMELVQGDWLQTGKNGTAKLSYDDGTEATIGSSSSLNIQRLSTSNSFGVSAHSEARVTFSQNGQQSSLKLWAGSVWSKVKSLLNMDDSYEVETPTAVMGVRGTLYLVSVNPENGATQGDVIEGVVGVTQNNEATQSAPIQLVTMGQTLRLVSLDEPLPEHQIIDPKELIRTTQPEILVQLVNDIMERTKELAVLTQEQQQAYGQTGVVDHLKAAIGTSFKVNELISFGKDFVTSLQTSDKLEEVKQVLKNNNQSLDQLQSGIDTLKNETEELRSEVVEAAQEAGVSEEEIETISNGAAGVPPTPTTPNPGPTPPPPVPTPIPVSNNGGNSSSGSTTIPDPRSPIGTPVPISQGVPITFTNGVSLDFGDLDFPQDAKIQAVDVTSSPSLENLPDGMELAGEALDFTLTTLSGTVGASFESPVSLTMPLKAGADRTKVGIYYLNEDSMWVYQDSAVVDGTVVALVNHFSKYAVLTSDNPVQLESQSVLSDGTHLKLSFDQLLHSNYKTAVTDFSITANGIPIGVTRGLVDDNSLYLNLDQPILKNDHVKISYTVGVYHIRDLAGNSVPSFIDVQVSTDSLPGPRAVMNNPGTETVNEITVFFYDELSEETLSLQGVDQIIQGHQIILNRQTANSIGPIYLPIEHIAWGQIEEESAVAQVNQDYGHSLILTLKDPYTFNTGDLLDIYFVRNAVKNSQGEAVGAIETEQVMPSPFDQTDPAFEVDPKIEETTLSANSMDLKVKINENGTVHYLMVESTDVSALGTVTAEVVKSWVGEDHNDLSSWSGSIGLNAHVAATRKIDEFILSNTTYRLYVVAEDLFGNMTGVIELEVTTPSLGAKIIGLSSIGHTGIQIIFDKALAGDVSGQQAAFTVTDDATEKNNYFVSATSAGSDSSRVNLTVADFSQAVGCLHVEYDSSKGNLTDGSYLVGNVGGDYNPFNPTSLELASTMLSSGTVGVSYNQIITASGGTGTYSYALTNGTIPAGITLNEDGIFTGTATTPGAFTFTVTVTDSARATKSATFSLTISVHNSTIDGSLEAYILGEAAPQIELSYRLGEDYSNGQVVFTLPDGITAKLGDGIRIDGDESYGIGPDNIINSRQIKIGSITAIDGAMVILTLNQNIQVGSWDFSVKGDADGSGPKESSSGIGAELVTLTCSGGTTPSPSLIFISGSVLNDTMQGLPYSVDLEIMGGLGPYTFSLQNGSSLPLGLSLTPDGFIVGTSETSGSFEFFIVVNDSSTPPKTVTKEFRLIINPFDALDQFKYRNPLGSANSKKAVVFADNSFVSVGDAGSISTSIDGESWKSEDSGTNHNLEGIAFGNGNYVVVGDSGTILTSPDGIVWTTRYSGITQVLNGVAYGNNTFVTVGGYGSVILTSENGISWNAQQTAGLTLGSIAFVNGKFIATGLSTIVSSSDGITWSVENTGSSQWLSGVAYGNNIRVAVGNNGTVLRSEDGANWTVSPSYSTEFLNGVTFGKNTFVAVGSTGTILTSVDGLGWIASKSGGSNLMGVAFGQNFFVVVGDSGTVLTSVDSENWVLRGSVTDESLKGVAYVNNNFISVGFNGTLLTSSDGGTWTSRTSGTMEWLQGAAYGNNTYVAVGYNTTLTSDNGVEWTAKTLPSYQSLTGVAYGNHTFVAVGLYGAISTSTDGIDWITRYSGKTDWLMDVVYAKDMFVAVGSNGVVLTSPDGISWTPRSVGVNEWLNSVAYGNNTFVAVGGNGLISTSEDGVNWTTRTLSGAGWLYSIAYGNNTFMAVGGVVITSDNGSDWSFRGYGTVNQISFNGVAFGKDTFVLVASGGRIIQSDVSAFNSTISNFTCTTNTDTTATFTWTPAVEATGIKIEKALSGSGAWDDATIGTISLDVGTATVTGLTAATGYDFRLVVNGGIDAGNSNTLVNVVTDPS